MAENELQHGATQEIRVTRAARGRGGIAAERGRGGIAAGRGRGGIAAERGRGGNRGGRGRGGIVADRGRGGARGRGANVNAQGRGGNRVVNDAPVIPAELPNDLEPEPEEEDVNNDEEQDVIGEEVGVMDAMYEIHEENRQLRAQLSAREEELALVRREQQSNRKRSYDARGQSIADLLDHDDGLESMASPRWAKRVRMDTGMVPGVSGDKEVIPAATNFRQYNNRLEKFDGSKDYEIWWSDACGYFKQFDYVSEEDKVKLLYAAVVGNAKFVLDSGSQTFTISAQINEKLTRSFVSKISWFSKLNTTLQKPRESVDEFHIRLRVLVTRAFGHCGMEASEMDNYVRDLLRTNTLPEISAKLRISTHSTLQDTLYSASLYEQALDNEKPSREVGKL